MLLWTRIASFAYATLVLGLILQHPQVLAEDINLCDIDAQTEYDLGDDLYLRQMADYDSGTFTMRLTYRGGRAWIGIGINEQGRNKMTPANAVIGRADLDASSVLKYRLSSDSEDASGVVPMDDDQQNLWNTYFFQSDESSTLIFTKLLEDSEQTVYDDSVWIFAVGLPDNQWEGKHKISGAFQFPLTACYQRAETSSPTSSPTKNPTKSPTATPVMNERPTMSSPPPTSSAVVPPPPTSAPSAAPVTPNALPTPTTTGSTSTTSGLTTSQANAAGFVSFSTAKPYRSLWAAHGIVLAFAWGILAPLAIGASMVKNGLIKLGFSKPFWFTMHMYLNVLTVVLTWIGFIIALVATAKDGDEHFEHAHHKAGLAIVILVTIQAFAGHFRPDLPKPSKLDHTEKVEVLDGSASASNKSDDSPTKATVPPKSLQRVAWEYGHRLVGISLLGLAWFNCHSGIQWQVLDWDDQKDLTGAFWGVTAGVSGTIFVLAYVIRV